MAISQFSLAKTPVFTTRQYAVMHEITLQAASKRLTTLAHHGHIQALTRGIWVIPDHPYFSSLGCVPILLGKETGYVSFLSALHLHGILSQIPKTIQVATTGHSRRLVTPFGTFEFFQIQPRMMVSGIEWSETPLAFRVAAAEKALLDTYYLSTRRGRRFAKLPELELPRIFRYKEFDRLANTQIQVLQVRNAVNARLHKLIISLSQDTNLTTSLFRKR